jgi:hypothetical protein
MKKQNKVLILKPPSPFSITFGWEKNYAEVKLHNGEDILKLAKLLSNFLENNNIKNTITYTTEL